MSLFQSTKITQVVFVIARPLTPCILMIFIRVTQSQLWRFIVRFYRSPFSTAQSVLNISFFPFLSLSASSQFVQSLELFAPFPRLLR